MKIGMLLLGLFELVLSAPSMAAVDANALEGSLSIPEVALEGPAGRALLVIFIIFIGLVRLGFCFSGETNRDSFGAYIVLVGSHVVETAAWYFFAWIKMENSPRMDFSCAYYLFFRALNAFWGVGVGVGVGGVGVGVGGAGLGVRGATSPSAASTAAVIAGRKGIEHDHSVLVVLPILTLGIALFGGRSTFATTLSSLWKGPNKELKTVDQVIIFMQVPENMKEEDELVMVLEKVGSLCVGNDTNCSEFAKSAPFWVALKNILQSSRLSTAVPVAKFGLRAITNLARNNDENKVKLGQSGACEEAARAMRTHSSDMDVAQWGSRAVGNLSFNADNRTKLGTAGSCEEIIRSLKLHPGSPIVAQWGCRAVAALAMTNPINRAKLGTAGACEEVTESLRGHPGCAEVAEEGCLAIQRLAESNNDNKLRLQVAGAEAAVALVLARTDMRSSVKVEARAALKTLY